MTENAAGRLGRMVRERRKALRLTQADVQSAGGPSTATLRLIENGKHTDFRPATSQPLESKLQWEVGSIAAILSGGDPVPLGAAGATPAVDVAEDNAPIEDDPLGDLKVLVAQGWRTAHDLTYSVNKSEASEELLAAARDAVHFIAATLIIRILSSGYASRLDGWLRRLYVERESFYTQLSTGKPRFPWLTEAEVEAMPAEDEIAGNEFFTDHRALPPTQSEPSGRDHGSSSPDRDPANAAPHGDRVVPRGFIADQVDAAGIEESVDSDVHLPEGAG